MSTASSPNELPPGLYDLVLTSLLEERIASSTAKQMAVLEPLDEGSSHTSLSQHFGKVLNQVFQSVAGVGRLPKQIELSNKIVQLIGRNVGQQLAVENVAASAKLLLEIHENDRARLERPDTPLGLSCLLTGTRLDPSLVSQLQKELQSTNRLDVLCSFIKWSGIRILESALREFTTKDGSRLRVITTSYLGATDLKAVEFLRTLPRTEVRVSYDTHRTRLHAKAYLCHRKTGFGSAYIGSANLSHAALTDGLEWTIKISQYESPHLWDRVAGTFETYWSDSEFVPYEQSDRPRLALALDQERIGSTDKAQQFVFDLRPYGFQQEILDRLHAERRLQGRSRQLIVAATGTGKTMIAAFDYRNWARDTAKSSTKQSDLPRLLFVAHREELLQQSLSAFRAVLRDQNFGELLVAGRQVSDFNHLFVSIQSYNSRELATTLSASHFAYVVVDEFHHAAAPSYQRLLSHVKPQVLLGLTATPERTDALDVLQHFDGHMSAQIRLPDAINRKLLCPFQYFGVTDVVNLDGLQWYRGGYQTSDLDRVYTGNDERSDLVIQKVGEVLLDPLKARGLGFCVSIAHAEYMSARFNSRGIPSACLSAESNSTDRSTVQAKLRRRGINFLFVVDLYNEGVDIPEIDTVLFLRPTESLIVFLQQLGRGLRLDDGKDCLTVIDFVGQAHRSFRFDLRFRALLSDPATSIKDQVEHGFTNLPAGCTIQLERLTRQYVLNNISQAVNQSRPSLIREIASLAGALGRTPAMSEFLERYELEPEDVYRRKVNWSRLCVQANVASPFHDPDEEALTRGLRRVEHIDGAAHLNVLLAWLTQTGQRIKEPPESTGRSQLMLDVSIWGKNSIPTSARDSMARLGKNPNLLKELIDLLKFRLNSITEVAPPYKLPFDCPLELHSQYTRDEILVSLGHWTRTRQPEVREGVLHLPSINCDAFFFTMNKTDKLFSPSTMYQDYAISDSLFHWQSQSTTSEDSPTGRRYVEHKKRNHTILHFGREDKINNGLSCPFFFLGPATYLSHVGSRPMSITWQLECPLPARLFRRFARLVTA